MKRIGLVLTLMLFATIGFSQEFEGEWSGELTAHDMKLPLTFDISSIDRVYTTIMDSPGQNTLGIKVSRTIVSGDRIVLEIPQLGAVYKARLNENNQLEGVFEQYGQSFELILEPSGPSAPFPKRPQQPKEPFPYYTEEVTFENKSASVTLAGTLTLPDDKGQFPVVVLISESGPGDRNATILEHQPFAVIADYFTRNGVGVLRYDDRGFGESTGDFDTSTTSDFSTDAEAALTYLLQRKEVNKSKIGLIGHSEGSIIASMVAARNKDVAFVILLAGIGLQGSEVLLLEQKSVIEADNIPEDVVEKYTLIFSGIHEIILKELDDVTTSRELKKYLEAELAQLPDSMVPIGRETAMKQVMEGVDNPWMKEFIRYDPRPALRKVSCPVLALNGSKDLQVPAKENIAAIEKALNEGWSERGKKEKHIELCILDGLNHLFQECATGSPSEYGKIEQTFSPEALTKMLDWMRDQGFVK